MKNKLYIQWRGLEWISLLGDSLYYLALLSYAANLPDPAVAIMIVSVSETLPNFLQIFLGVFSDGTIQRTKRFFQSGIVRGIIYLLIGMIIMSSTSLYGILLIGILNAISDVFGKYVELCIDPFIKFIVPAEKLEPALALNFVVTSSISLFANFLGAVIISLIGISQLAFLNALTFFSVAVGVKLIQPQLETIEKRINTQKHDSFSQIWQHIRHSLKELLAMKQMRLFFILAAGLNSVAVTTIPISSLFLADHIGARIVNLPFSIALIQGLIMLSGIIGSWFGGIRLKNLSTKAILLAAFAGNLLFILFLAVGQLWLGIASLVLSVAITSIFNLRFSSDIIRGISADKMGTIYGCMDTFFLVIPSIISLIFMGVASISFALYLLVVGLFCGSFLVFILKNDQQIYR